MDGALEPRGPCAECEQIKGEHPPSRKHGCSGPAWHPCADASPTSAVAWRGPPARGREDTAPNQKGPELGVRLVGSRSNSQTGGPPLRCIFCDTTPVSPEMKRTDNMPFLDTASQYIIFQL